MLRQLGALVAFVVVLAGCSSTDQVTVPNLHEKCGTEAYEQLRGLDLKVEIDGPIAVATNHCTRVGGHAPEAGNDVEAGFVVTLHPGVSPLGLLVVSEPDPVVLPDLIGVRLDIAVRRLDSLGLAWTTRTLPPPPVSDAPTLLEHYRLTKMEPGPGDDERMLHVAHASAYHWAEAPECEPRNRARSEWQVSRVYAVLGRAEPALHHARRCLEICEQNAANVEDWDLPFAYEALARAPGVAGNEEARRYERLAREAGAAITDPEDREHLEEALATL